MTQRKDTQDEPRCTSIIGHYNNGAPLVEKPCGKTRAEHDPSRDAHFFTVSEDDRENRFGTQATFSEGA